MSYPINYPTPQGANVQIFQAPVRAVTSAWTTEWVKPQGASMVWFTLIGAGGGGAGQDGANTNYGGGSGAVTNCMVPAFLIPDILQVRVGKGGAAGSTGNNGSAGTDTNIYYQQKATTGYTLLTAKAGGAGQVGVGIGGGGGTSTSANYFACAGFYQSIAGQTGATNTSVATTTFLQAGDGPIASTTPSDVQYGYSVQRDSTGSDGFFMLRPIIVGAGGARDANSPNFAAGNGGIGCGGAAGADAGGGNGGDGLVVIITW